MVESAKTLEIKEEEVKTKSITLSNVAIGEHRISGPLNDSDISYTYELYYMMVHNKLQGLEEEISVSNFEKALKGRKLDQEFNILDQLTSSDDHSKRFYKDVKVAALNRYIDILPFNDTRVTLAKRKGYSDVDTYINANYVNSVLGEDRKIIAAQGPKQNTVDHFWRMIVEQKVTLIVAVCSLSEGGRPKCHKYWPNGSSDTDPEFKGLLSSSIRVTEVESTALGTVLQSRYFDIETVDGVKHRVRQVHYTGWPDHGVPTGDSVDQFSLLLDEFILMLLNSAPTEKAIIHCSAGIGRTGTTATLAHLLISISSQFNSGVKDPTFSVFSTVRRLREQRYSMVQMPEQYKFIYQYLVYWLKKNKRLT